MDITMKDAFPPAVPRKRSQSQAGAQDEGRERGRQRREVAPVSKGRNEICDTCFGVIDLSGSISGSSEGLFTDKDPIDVEINSDTGMLRLVTKLRSEIGAAYSPDLCDLWREYTVRMKAFVSPPNAKSRLGWDRVQYARLHIRIVLYGPYSSHVSVGNFLSKRRVFLQQPVMAEFDKRTTYFNPHYLPGPDGAMAPIIDESVSLIEGMALKTYGLTETQRARVLHVFDSAPVYSHRINVAPSSRVRSELKDHQLTALAMMMEKESGIFPPKAKFPSIWELKRIGNGEQRYHHIITGTSSDTPIPTTTKGGLLADEMGLGKTLPVLALVAWHLDNLKAQPKMPENESRSTLIVVPKSVVTVWKKQIKDHMKPESIKHLLYLGAPRSWRVHDLDDYDIVLTTYNTLRLDHESKGPLSRRIWARVILDEAHFIRDRNSQTFQAACRTRSPRRWCLTGTPIQNRLDDFGALLTFIGVPPFTYEENFRKHIEDPIKHKHDNAFERLKELVAATCLRRTKKMIFGDTGGLPKKHDPKICSFKLDDEDEKLYNFFAREVSKVAQLALDKTKKKAKGQINILSLISVLRLICNHGMDLLPASAMKVWKARDTGPTTWDALSKVINSECASCKREGKELGEEGVEFRDLQCGHMICSKCDGGGGGAVGEDEEGEDEDGEESQVEEPTCAACLRDSSRSLVTKENLMRNAYVPSAKVRELLQNLRAERNQVPSHQASKPPKSVVFTFFTKMLDLIERGLRQEGFSFVRIDGSKSVNNREQSIKRFNNDPGCNVMLATIKSAGEGIDLTAARFVHIMEPQWNPMVEEQAIDRVHRMGQTQDVFITLYSVEDSIESYVRRIQKRKMQMIQQALSEKLEDEDTINKTDLGELVKILGVS